jgi:hypothetical protein
MALSFSFRTVIQFKSMLVGGVRFVIEVRSFAHEYLVASAIC